MTTIHHLRYCGIVEIENRTGAKMTDLTHKELLLRASTFATEWQNSTKEKQDSHSFLNEFFEVFGIDRKKVAVFEHFVEKLIDHNALRNGYIDLFWPGKILIEQKSAGGNLENAFTQAMKYWQAIHEEDKPQWVMVCDFQNFLLRDVKAGVNRTEELLVAETWKIEHRFSLNDSETWANFFATIFFDDELQFLIPDDLDYHVAEKLAELRDGLYDVGYPEKELEQFLMRLVFCLFAADSGIFDNRGILFNYLRRMTRIDGHDFGIQLELIYKVLNREDRSKTFIAGIKDFPYVNGGIFEGGLPCTPFNPGLREIVLDLGKKNWRQISPIIFGTLFESVMEPKERRELGAHYTSEENILRVLGPLFLDDLSQELAEIKTLTHQRSEKLLAFEQRLRGLKFFDPACGCGSFLLCAYEQIRQLEHESILERRASAIAQKEPVNGNPDYEPWVNVDQFFGIELNPTAQAITEAALWMIDQLQNTEFCKMATIQNRRAGDKTVVLFSRIPITAAPTIVLGDALELEWETILPAALCSYIIGNPPFVGQPYRTEKQQKQMVNVWGEEGRFGMLDYVTCWYKKACDYSSVNKKIDFAFVSTNSITQGDQVGTFWEPLFRAGLNICFAHQTFQWKSETPNNAAVHCVIVGMTYRDKFLPRIFKYKTPKSKPIVESASMINGYLEDMARISIAYSPTPPADRLRMLIGSKVADGSKFTSNLILNDSQKSELLLKEPNSEKWLRPYLSADDLINGTQRWCLWLKDANPSEIRKSKEIQLRLKRVAEFRSNSVKVPTQEFAKFPSVFTEDRQPVVDYLAIPGVSSELRRYIPMKFVSSTIIASNAILMIPGATIIYFAILTSSMHMSWTRAICGRLESRIRYAAAIYNAFPWPVMNQEQETKIVQLAEKILSIRDEFQGSSLADLYGEPMNPRLLKAHQVLDRAVDRLYRKEKFENDIERVAHLFTLYKKQNRGQE